MSASNCMRAWTKSNTQPESHFCIGFFLTPCASVFTSGNLPYTLVPPRPGFSLLTNPVPGLESHSGLGLDTLHGYRCPHDCLGMSAFLVANHTCPPPLLAKYCHSWGSNSDDLQGLSINVPLATGPCCPSDCSL